MMKTLKMFGLAAIAALGLMAFLGASSASADVLCTENNTPGPCGKVVNSISASLASGSTAALSNTAGEPLVTCSESSVSGTVEKQGEGVEPEGSISSLTWGGCNHTADTIANGRLKVETRISIKEGLEVHTNTVTAFGSKVTVSILGVSCTYGPGTEGISIGDLTVGIPATIHANAIVNRLEGSFLCPSTARWEATYQVTNHTGLWVSIK